MLDARTPSPKTVTEFASIATLVGALACTALATALILCGVVLAFGSPWFATVLVVVAASGFVLVLVDAVSRRPGRCSVVAPFAGSAAIGAWMAGTAAIGPLCLGAGFTFGVLAIGLAHRRARRLGAVDLPTCPHCGHFIVGVRDVRCPECGEAHGHRTTSEPSSWGPFLQRRRAGAEAYLPHTVARYRDDDAPRR